MNKEKRETELWGVFRRGLVFSGLAEQGDKLRAEAGDEQPSNRQIGVKSVPRKSGPE